jgi:hypothetical protein
MDRFGLPGFESFQACSIAHRSLLWFQCPTGRQEGMDTGLLLRGEPDARQDRLRIPFLTGGTCARVPTARTDVRDGRCHPADGCQERRTADAVDEGVDEGLHPRREDLGERL